MTAAEAGTRDDDWDASDDSIGGLSDALGVRGIPLGWMDEPEAGHEMELVQQAKATLTASHRARHAGKARAHTRFAKLCKKYGLHTCHKRHARLAKKHAALAKGGQKRALRAKVKAANKAMRRLRRKNLAFKLRRKVSNLRRQLHQTKGSGKAKVRRARRVSRRLRRRVRRAERSVNKVHLKHRYRPHTYMGRDHPTKLHDGHHYRKKLRRKAKKQHHKTKKLSKEYNHKLWKERQLKTDVKSNEAYNRKWRAIRNRKMDEAHHKRLEALAKHKAELRGAALGKKLAKHYIKKKHLPKPSSPNPMSRDLNKKLADHTRKDGAYEEEARTMKPLRHLHN